MNRGERLIAAACFLAACSLLQAQGASAAATCKAVDVNTTTEFVNGPADYFTVAFNLHNTSGRPCVLDSWYGPSFSPDRVPGEKPFALCYDCEHWLPNGQYPVIAPLILNPDQLAHLAFRWKSKPPDETVRCLQPQVMWGPVLVNAPALLKPVCSAIDVSRYGAGVFPGSASSENQVFNLTSSRNMYYEGEFFFLHVSPAQPTKGDSCPTFYMRQRSPDGTTRIDTVLPAAFKGCSWAVPGLEMSDWQSGFLVDSGARSRWTGLGEHTFEIFQVAEAPENGRISFVHSNQLRADIGDASTIPRKWGPKVKGLAVDLTLDKDTFQLREDVALHVAIENFDAVVPVYAYTECGSIQVEIFDAAGQPVPVSGRFATLGICTGHGFTLRYEKGKVVPYELALLAEGWLPNHTGTFTAVVTWAALVDSRNDSSGRGGRIYATPDKPYATVKASATFHVVDHDKSPAQ